MKPTKLNTAHNDRSSSSPTTETTMATHDDEHNQNDTNDTQSGPLLFMHDAQRRKRIHQKAHEPQVPQLQAQTKSMVRLQEQPRVYVNDEPQPRMLSSSHKSKSHAFITTPSSNSLSPKYQQRIHKSNSGPPPIRKRAFKLSEPSDSIQHAQTHSVSPRTIKKVSRNFMAERSRQMMNRSKSHSPTASVSYHSYSKGSTTPSSVSHLSTTSSSYTLNGLNGPSTPTHASSISLSSNPDGYGHNRRKRSSFKLGDDTMATANNNPASAQQVVRFIPTSSFESYQNKYKVHKPNMKPGSNQFLLSQKMQELQQNLHQDANSAEHKEREAAVLSNADFQWYSQSFGKPFEVLKTIKLPRYESGVPLILIELKKKLHACDGLRQRRIFHHVIAAKSFTSVAALHHQISKLIVTFFEHLPHKLLDAVSMASLQGIDNMAQIEAVAEKIPEPNLTVLLWLWDLLADTIEFAMSNKMSIDALTKCFAPRMVSSEAQFATIMNLFKYGIEWRLHLREQQ